MGEVRNELLEALLASYREVGGINHIDGANLPSKQNVSEICRTLLRLLFPGFYQSEDGTNRFLEDLTREKLQWVCRNLGREISKSLAFSPDNTPGVAPSAEDAEEKAREIVCGFVHHLPVIRRLLKTDVAAAYAGDPAAQNFEEIILAYPGLEAIAIQRMAHWLYQNQIPFIPRMMTEWAHARTGIDIHPGARIGEYFFIDHGTGVVIGESCIIGNEVKIYHGVTLGARSTTDVAALRRKKRHPTIEDRVTIYPGATILGGETIIGTGSTINGNVFLSESVPPHSRVAHEKHGLVIKPLPSEKSH
ncbi:MAG: serine O-acetyltransferase EpsC [Candidatus Methylacidiphilales bacterium]